MLRRRASRSGAGARRNRGTPSPTSALEYSLRTKTGTRTRAAVVYPSYCNSGERGAGPSVATWVASSDFRQLSIHTLYSSRVGGEGQKENFTTKLPRTTLGSRHRTGDLAREKEAPDLAQCGGQRDISPVVWFSQAAPRSWPCRSVAACLGSLAIASRGSLTLRCLRTIHTTDKAKVGFLRSREKRNKGASGTSRRHGQNLPEGISSATRTASSKEEYASLPRDNVRW